ncbi:MAG: SusC/RagA family TonB-linked outer membrane protein [Bacteroidales bacterium]|nr:SusC/RagA family TonB-linked outer membrane protein [Bacteroidales bacterium]
MRKIMLFFAFFGILGMQLFAQKTITGTVVGADDGVGISGVTVLVDGTNIGTVTDLDGKYVLNNVPDDATSLKFSLFGMLPKELPITGSVIDCAMEIDAVALGDVVITALGVSKEKKALGYSVQDLNSDEFSAVRDPNIVNSLSGKIAGVQITSSSGGVGSSSRIVLRGAASITGNNEPLFIVDGVPINNTNYGDATYGGGTDQPSGSADINPDDIESISVLKGANAAALYGSRAANGVIIIKTKTGKKAQGLGVSVNSSTTFETPLILPTFQNSYGQGASHTFFEWIDGQNGSGGVDESWGMPLNIGLEAVQFSSNGEYPEEWVAYPNNIKDFYDLGITTNNNISFANGGEKSSFRLSYTNMQQKGMVPNTSLQRNTFNGTASVDLTSKLYANFSANYIITNSDNLPTGGYNNENPVQQMIWSGRQVDFEKLRDYENLPLCAEGTAAAGTPLNWNTVFQNNPYWVQHTNFNKLSKNRVIGNINVGYKFTDWLTLQLSSGTDYWTSITTNQKAHGSNEYPFGLFREVSRTWYENNSSFLVMINRDINTDLNVSLSLGGNTMYQSYSRMFAEASQLELEGVYNLSNVKSGVSPTLTNYFEKRKINSLYFSGQVAFKKYVYFEFSGRNDWSSVLPIENNSFFYPAASLSLVVTEMLGMESDVLTFAKVRGSWAQVGGDGALNPYSLTQTFAFRDDSWGNVLLPYNGNTLNNPNLVSETTNSLEFGLDMRMFKGRVTLDLTYYNSKSKDLLVPVEVSASTGYLFAWDNIGEMANSGVEVLLGLDIIKNDNFVWNTTVNFAKAKNEVVSLGGLESLDLGGQWNMTLQAREGYPYGVIFGPAFLRSPDGDVIYKNGIPVIDETYQILGDIQPDWTGGINNRISFKGLTLSFLVDAKMGGEIHSMTTTWGRYAGVLNETLEGRETGVIGIGVIDNGDGTYRTNDVITSTEEYNKTAYSNNVVESSVFDASYIKFRQLTFGYTFAKIGNLPIKDLSFSVVGRNLAMIYSKIPHIDPETAFSSLNGQQGQEFGQLPSTRSIGFNINFKF